MRRNYEPLSGESSPVSYIWYILAGIIIIGGAVTAAILLTAEPVCVNGSGNPCVCHQGWTGKTCETKLST